MPSDELSAWLRLTLTHGVGPDSARKLLAAFGLPHVIFEQTHQALTQVVSNKQAQALQQLPEQFAQHRQTLQDWLAASPEHRVTTLADADYPPSLLHIADPPLVLYSKGLVSWPELARQPCLAIVGSRSPTPQGQSNAQQFARALSEAGLCIVSGLARGVDGAAHRGALEGGSPTVAVVGTGLDRVYPKAHLTLAHEIAAHGLVVSEFPLGTPPLATNFPRRNRIISGLSLGTLVVEAALQSGSLITARMALEQNKDVFAIPGSIHSLQSRGCHALIKQGAKLVETPLDIQEELQLALPVVATAGPSEPAHTPSQHELLDAMGYDAVSFDVLQARTGIATARLQTELFDLELAGQVARLPGGLLQRMGLT